MGYCPSGRLFEAAACGAPILSDWWEGLEAFFEPGEEILVAHDDRGRARGAANCRRGAGANRARRHASARSPSTPRQRRARELERMLETARCDSAASA